MTENVTHGEALVAIAAEDPAALRLVGDIMERNARDLAWTFETLYAGEKAAHERTQARLDAALDRLALIEERTHWLLGGRLSDEWGAS